MTDVHTLNIKTTAGPATLELSAKGRTYAVKSFQVDGRPELSLGFSPTAGGVEDLDGKSDMAQCFNISNKVRCGTVVLGSTEMRAASLEELAHALKQVKVTPFNREEI